MGKFSHKGEHSRLRMPKQVCFYPLNGLNIVFQQPVNITSQVTLGMAMFLRATGPGALLSLTHTRPLDLPLPGEQTLHTRPKSKLRPLSTCHVGTDALLNGSSHLGSSRREAKPPAPLLAPSNGRGQKLGALHQGSGSGLTVSPSCHPGSTASAGTHSSCQPWHPR